MNILIIDDDTQTRTIMTKLLQSHGTVAAAENGKKALDELKRKKYDLIFLDVEMPDMDGLEFLRHLREAESIAGIPIGSGTKVVMATGHDDAKTLFASFADFCEDFLVKPVTKEKIDTTVAHIKSTMQQ